MDKTKIYKIVKLFTIILIAMLVVILISMHFTPLVDEGVRGDEGKNGIVIEIFDIVEYTTFVDTSSLLPDNFVTADMLAGLGTFQAFVGFPYGDYSVYQYGLEFENGFLSSFYINPNHDYSSWRNSSQNEVGETMANIATEGQVYIVSNGITYYYNKGLVRYIAFTVNDTRYEIFVGGIENYPSLDSNHIVNKLLSKSSEDQIAAYNQLVDMVTK